MRCSNQGHNKDKCIGTEVICYQCEADQQAFLTNCQKFKRETEILQIPTISEQDFQSDASSEDASETDTRETKPSILRQLIKIVRQL